MAQPASSPLPTPLQPSNKPSLPIPKLPSNLNNIWKKPALAVSVALITIVIIFSGLYLAYQSFGKGSATNLISKLGIQPNSQENINKKKDKARSKLEKNIRTAFASADDLDIINLINLASEENNIKTRYQYYVKAFNKMSESYKKSQNPSIKLTMLDLKLYARVFPQYKDSDMVLP